MTRKTKTTDFRRLAALVISIAMVLSLAIPAYAEPVSGDICTYYFYAPESYGAPNVYWWIPSQNASWPGVPMESAPEIGENVYKVTAPCETSRIIFSGTSGSPQTIDIDVEDCAYSGSIYVITGTNISGLGTGEWLSVNPSDNDYYRKSPYYYGTEPIGTETPSVPDPDPDPVPVNEHDTGVWLCLTSYGSHDEYFTMNRDGEGYFVELAAAETQPYAIAILDNGQRVFKKTFTPQDTAYSIGVTYVPETNYFMTHQLKYRMVEVQENWDTVYYNYNTSDMPMSRYNTNYDYSDNSYNGNIDYYLLCPNSYLEDRNVPSAYWWTGSSTSSDWPGNKMTASNMGLNVYKISVPRGTSTIIFNDSMKNYYQSVNINLTEEATGRNNVGNMIYVFDDPNPTTTEYDYYSLGKWFSLDPNSPDYYRRSDSYKRMFGEDYLPDTYVINNNSIIAGEEAPEDTPTPDEPEGKTVFFRADGDYFGLESKKYFYIWDTTNGMFATKNGWVEINPWGSKKILGTLVDVGGGLFESYPFTIPEGHDVYLIVSDYATGNQTCDIYITEEAFGNTVYLTGNWLENPVDRSLYTIEAKVENADSCGPAKTLTSTCLVIGSALIPNKNYSEYIAGQINRYYNDYYSGYNYQNINAAIKAFGVTQNSVWSAYCTNYGYSTKVKNLIFGVDYNGLQPYVVVHYTETMDMALCCESGDTPIFYVDIYAEAFDYVSVKFYDGEGDSRWFDLGENDLSGTYRLNYDPVNGTLWYETMSVDYSYYYNQDVYLKYVYEDRYSGRDKVGRVYLGFNEYSSPISYSCSIYFPQKNTTYDVILNGIFGKSYVEIYVGNHNIFFFKYCPFDSSIEYWSYGSTSENVETADYPDHPATADYPDVVETAEEPCPPDYPYNPDTPDEPAPQETCDVADEETSDMPAQDHTGETDDQQRLIGDITGDGNINSADALSAIRISVGLETCGDDLKSIADVDGDGLVSSIDALSILRYSVSKGHLGRVGQTA